jgi:hypothetical protein
MVAGMSRNFNVYTPEEFRKNAVKFGWELWEEKSAA